MIKKYKKRWWQSSPTINMNDPEVESQWFLIKSDRLPRGINTIILGTIYHLLTVYPNSGILALGDFNQFHPGNLCGSFKLKKIVKKPTRRKCPRPSLHKLVILL